jgi:hypothetical protein
MGADHAGAIAPGQASGLVFGHVAEGWQRQTELYKSVFASEDAREGAAVFAESERLCGEGYDTNQ